MGAIVNTQHKYQDAGGSGGNVVLTLAFTPTPGNLLAVWAKGGTEAGIPLGVTDNSAGNPSYDLDASATVNWTDDLKFFSRVVGASVPTTLTFNFGNNSPPWLSVVEMSGMSPTSRVVGSQLTGVFSTQGFGQVHTLPWTSVNVGDVVHMPVSVGGSGYPALAMVTGQKWSDPLEPTFFSIIAPLGKAGTVAGAESIQVTTTGVDCNVTRWWVAYRTAGVGGIRAPMPMPMLRIVQG